MNTNFILLLIVLFAVAISIYRMMKKTKSEYKETDFKDLPDSHEEFETNSTVLSTEDWKLKLKKAGLGHHWNKFEQLLKHEIAISPELVDESEIKTGQSKIGGRPDLPAGHEWFRDNDKKALSFLAQINFSEATHYDESNQLPDEGIIYFFYTAEQDAWGFDPKDKDQFKVFYFNGDKTTLKRADFPPNLPERSRFKSCKLSFASAVSMPNWEYDELGEFLSEEEQDIYTEITVDGLITKLLGHSDNIQGTMEEECQLVTNGINCGEPAGYNDPRAKELKKGASQWTLLFQIDSIDEAEMMWGDMGRIYFWIKKEDLANKQFEKSWMVLQCS